MFETEQLSARTLMNNSDIIRDQDILDSGTIEVDTRESSSSSSSRYYCSSFFTRFFRAPETSILDVREIENFPFPLEPITFKIFEN